MPDPERKINMDEIFTRVSVRQFEDRPVEKEKVEKIVVEEMQNAYKLSVPLIADAGWGKNWLEAH